MLRVLESGYKVKMVPTQHDTYSVDTMTDLQKVEALMVDDPLINKYHEVNK
jgi:3-deoxy-manno-octulosonate cytidylyltransferase (CMP-KDO synthetase)